VASLQKDVMLLGGNLPDSLSQYLDIGHEDIEEIEDDEDIRQIEDTDTPAEERINVEKQDIEDEPTTTKSS
jgi:hypothetical protein